jgi:DNA-3-methyladenine glycosylase
MTLASVIGGERVSGIIVETEAYLGIHDPASHAWQGRRHKLYGGIWGPDGSWYIYRSYGIHWCVNLTAPTADDAGAILIRAVQPLTGLDVMRQRRGGVPDARLADGPGKLTQAFAITDAENGLKASRRSALRLLPRRDVIDEDEIVAGPRVGISRAVDWPLRFRWSVTAERLRHLRPDE